VDKVDGVDVLDLEDREDVVSWMCTAGGTPIVEREQ
jgi:hypothetical protein